MKKSFKFYFENAKERNPIQRSNVITISNPTDDLSIDVKHACNVFEAAFGNGKKTRIVKIQELDENGEVVGLDITPSEETTMVPFRK
jgi:hypothetical protein